MTAEEILIRLRLDNRGVQAGLAAAAAAVGAFSREVSAAGKKTAFTRAETCLWRTSLYTLRRELYHAQIAVLGFAAVSLELGFDFNEAQEKGVAAFTGILGSTRLARREMAALVGLTHETGFQLPQLTTAATRMLEFGFTVKETNAQLRAFGIFAGRRNLGIEGVSALTGIFARIRSSGLLTARTLQQLIRLGVNVPEILRTQLGLTNAQTRAIAAGKLSVRAQDALPALTAGLAATPGAEALRGLFGIARSWFAELAATVEQPLFAWATRIVPRVNAVLARAVGGFKAGGIAGALLAVDPSGKLLKNWQTFTGLVSTSWQVLSVWFTGVRTFGLPILVALGGLLGFLSRHTTLLKLALYPLTAAYVVHRTALLGVRAAMWLYIASMKAGWLAIRAFYAAERIATATTWLFNAALYANPFVAIVVAVVAAGVAFGVLYWKVKAFHDFVNRYWPYLLILFGPFGFVGALALVRRHLDDLAGAFRSVVDWINRIAGALAHPFRFAIDVAVNLPGGDLAKKALGLLKYTPPVIGVTLGEAIRHRVQGRALGGPVLAGHPYFVGEQGPELFWPSLPGTVQPLAGPAPMVAAPAAVKPLPAPAPISWQDKLTIINHPGVAKLYIGAREIGEATFNYAAEVRAGA